VCTHIFMRVYSERRLFTGARKKSVHTHYMCLALVCTHIIIHSYTYTHAYIRKIGYKLLERVVLGHTLHYIIHIYTRIHTYDRIQITGASAWVHTQAPQGLYACV
jgi:hypothetical protein